MFCGTNFCNENIKTRNIKTAMIETYLLIFNTNINLKITETCIVEYRFTSILKLISVTTFGNLLNRAEIQLNT